MRQGTHVAISAALSARVATFLSRFSIFCWPYWASNKYLAANDPCMQGSLAGPIGPARYILLAQKGQQLIENLENMSENKAESAKCVPCLRYDFSCWVLLFPMLLIKKHAILPIIIEVEQISPASEHNCLILKIIQLYLNSIFSTNIFFTY